MGNIRHGFYVCEFKNGIADGFDKNRSGFICNRFFLIFRIKRIDKFNVDSELRQDIVKHRVGAAVKITP